MHRQLKTMSGWGKGGKNRVHALRNQRQSRAWGRYDGGRSRCHGRSGDIGV